MNNTPNQQPPAVLMEPETTSTEIMPAACDALERAAIDSQIATAKRYPRSVGKFLAEAEQAVCASAEIAEGCFYALKRRGKDGKESIIEGPSIRLAEIAASAWGNIRTGARIVEIGERTLKAQGVAHDVEKNVATTVEVIRRITSKSGMRYNDDMIATTANAAMSIALRNAILRVVPRIYIQTLMKKAQAVASGNQMTLADKRDRWLKWWAQRGIDQGKVLAWLGVKSADEITAEHIRLMAGLKTSLEEGHTTLEAEFGDAEAKQQPETMVDYEAHLREMLAAEGIQDAAFIAWAKSRKLLTEAQGIEDLGRAKCAQIIEQWETVKQQIKR
jgi:hypothetical protein